jgi:hypothetical protein
MKESEPFIGATIIGETITCVAVNIAPLTALINITGATITGAAKLKLQV